jgi:hypothetical protein
LADEERAELEVLARSTKTEFRLRQRDVDVQYIWRFLRGQKIDLSAQKLV